MARPTKPKELKPKTLEQVSDAAEAPNKKFPSININYGLLTVTLVIILFTGISSAASVYFLAPIVIKPLLKEIAVKGEGEESGEEEGKAVPAIGPVLDLEEFTVNLKDPGGERYLRIDLSLSVTAEDPAFESLTGEALHKWEEDFNMEMAHYVPAVRDIVISSLTKRTAAELSTAMGKEQIKQEVKNNAEGLFHGKRKVIRVNFENFIIQ